MALIDDGSIEARLNGYSWDEIDGHLADSTDAALAAGYTPPEINDHLGFAPQGRNVDRTVPSDPA